MQKSILVIDDDGFDCMIISALLNQTNYKVVAECKKGLEGIFLAQKLLPDFILVDKVMPEIDGLKVIGELNKLKIKSKIILISGDDLSDVQEYCNSLNVFHFIQKPISRNMLLSVLDSI